MWRHFVWLILAWAFTFGALPEKGDHSVTGDAILIDDVAAAGFKSSPPGCPPPCEEDEED